MGQEQDSAGRNLARPADTAAASSSSGGSVAQQEPRRPRDLPGLLRWSAEVQERAGGVGVGAGAGAGAGGQPLAPLDPERRQFLQEAFKGLTVDEVQLMKEAVATLSKPATDDAAVAAQETALDELHSLVENQDNASDLHKIGGFTVVIDCLRRPQASLRHRAANAIAACVQNHPPVQQIALDLGTMPLLVGLLDDADPVVRKKAIYALSALVREYAPAQKAFVEAGGITLLRNGMLDDSVQVRMKAVFLLRNLIISDPSLKDAVREAELLPVLVVLATDDYEPLREQALATLVLVAEDNAANTAVLRGTDVGLRKALEAARTHHAAAVRAGNAEDVQDEQELVTKLWAICFP